MFIRMNGLVLGLVVDVEYSFFHKYKDDFSIYQQIVGVCFMLFCFFLCNLQP